ncbi:hypothetical protein [Cellulomonas fimi]|uniref:hypothetical protein n=1 Tax=Cellulomonas sp. RIT-PI-Y TaxID=3035297 RepID=UPI0021DA563E
MTDTILVLTEDTLTSADVAHILSLHDGEQLDYRVLVPADTERNVLVSLVDQLSLGELREALDTVLGREPAPDRATADAAQQLSGSLEALSAAGARATGTVVDDDPLPALRAALTETGAREVVVATYPHALEDTFHQDWASQAREELHTPVLHLYLGTSELG